MNRIYRKLPPLHLSQLSQQLLKKPAFKKSLWFFASLASILLLVVVLNLINAGKTKAVWYDESFAFRKKITIGNSGSAVTTPRKVKIDTDTAALVTAGQLQADCDDVRFTDANGDVLEFFIDTNEAACNTSSTDFFVKLLTVPTGNTDIYFYYGNPTAVNGRSEDFFAQGTTGVGLKGAWQMDEASGSTAFDVGPAAINGTITGATYVTGKVGTALTFDATTGKYVITGSTDQLNNSTTTNTFWMKPNRAANAAEFWTPIATPTGTETFGWSFLYVNNAASCPGGLAPCVTSRKWTPEVNAALTRTLEANTWYHIAQAWDNTNVRLYIDGKLVATTASAGPSSGSGPLCIGGDSRAVNCAQQNPDAVMDDVRVYKRNLSLAEVNAIYNNGQGTTIDAPINFAPTSGPTAGSAEKAPAPAAYWKFDEGFGTTTRDSTSSNYTGTLSSATWLTEDMCVTGKCLRFDGSTSTVNIDNAALNNFGDYGASTGFTLQAWVRTEATSGGVVMFGASANNTQFMGLGITAGKLSMNYRTDNNNEMGGNGLVGVTAINDGTWHLVTATRNGNVFSVYVDGILSASLTDSTTFNTMTTNRQTVGALRRLTNASFLQGDVDEVKLYSYARTEAQIKTDTLRASSLYGNSAAFGQQDTSFLNKNLRAYWKFDEASGNAADNSGNGYTLTNTNIATYTSGKFANAGTFASASSQYFTIADNADISVGNNPVTFTAWVNATTLGANRDILTKWGVAGTNAQLEYQLGYENATAKFYFSVGDGTNVGSVYASNFGAPTTATWYLIVAQYDPVKGLIAIGVNNSQMNTAAWTTGIQDNTYNLSVGRAGANNFNYWNGKIDEVRIYKRVLAEKEIASLYNWAPEPVAHWKMEEASGSRFDSSGNAQTLVENNGTSPGVHGQYGNAAYLQNTAGQYLTTPDTAKLSMGNLDFTVEAWVKQDNKNDHRYIISKGTGNTAATREYALYWDVTLDKFIWIVSNGTTETITTSTVTVTAGTWYFLAAYYDSVQDQAVLVVNGSTVNSTTNTTGSQDLGGNLFVGASAAATSHYGGLIDEVKVYRYVRTNKQIVEDMNGGHPAGGSPIASQIAYYKFDEQAGAIANNSNTLLPTMTGTITGALWRTASSTSCKFNGCLYFDGVDDIVTVSDNAALDATSSGTISLWVKPSTLTQDTFANFVARTANDGTGGSASGISYSLVWRHTDGVIQGGISNGTTFLAVPMPLLTDTNWHHIAFTWDRSSLKLYKDGILGGSIVNTTGITAQNTALTLKVGGDAFGTASSSDNWEGMLDEVKVYNSTLTAEEVLIDKNAGSGAVLGDQNLSSLENDLNGYWKLEETTGNRIDSSGKGNTLASNNAVGFNAGKVSSASAQLIRASNKYLSIADNASLSMLNTDFTMSAWFYQDTTATGDRVIAGKADAVGNNREYYIARLSAGTLAFTVSQDGTNTTTVTTPDFSNTASAWNFVAAWYDSRLRTINIQLNNGIVYSATHTTGVTDDTSPFMIGAVGTVGSPLSLFDGRIDEVRVYKRVLSPLEREQLFNYAAGPAAYWDMDQSATSTNATDKSGNEFTAVGTGTSFGHGKYGSAMVFDDGNDIAQCTDASCGGAGKLDLDSSSVTGFTAQSWVYPTTDTGTTYFLIKTGVNDAGYAIRRENQGFVYFFGNNGCTNNSTSTGPTLGYPANKWYHIALTLSAANPGTATLYVNGVTVATSGSNYYCNGTGNVRIGAGSTASMIGMLDDVKIYQYIRSQDQIMLDVAQGAPIALYKFDECASTTVYNTAPNATGSGTLFNGTIVPGGGANTSAGNCNSGTSSEMWNDGTVGKRNASLGFDGTDDYINIDDTPEWDVSTISVSAWVKPSSVSAFRVIASRDSGTTGDRYWALQINDSGKLYGYVCMSDDSCADTSGSRPPTMSAGNWYHVAMTYDGYTIRLYLNGVLVDILTSSAVMEVGSEPIAIGRKSNSTLYFDGLIDDVRIYNYALKTSQVGIVYNNGAVSFMPTTGAP